MKKLMKHYGYYAVLILIASFAILFMSRNDLDAQMRMLIIVLITFFYVGWGVLHHYLHHNLTIKIVLEYVLIGSLGITLIFFLIK